MRQSWKELIADSVGIAAVIAFTLTTVAFLIILAAIVGVVKILSIIK
jgi:hypothetical protein